MKVGKSVLGGLSILILITGLVFMGCNSTPASTSATAPAPVNPDELRVQADQYFDQNNLANALPLYIQLGEMDNVSINLTAHAAMRAGFIYGRNGDEKKANEWYLKAAELGHPVAQFNLGNYYSRQGDTEKAVEWWLKADEIGYANAQFNLGNYYSRQGDEKKAFEMYLKAAEQGHADAQFNVGIYYWEGREGAVEINDEKAIEWLTKAKENGHEDAEGALLEIEEILKQ